MAQSIDVALIEALDEAVVAMHRAGVEDRDIVEQVLETLRDATDTD